MNHWRDDYGFAFWGEEEAYSLPYRPAHEPYDPVALELAVDTLLRDFDFVFDDAEPYSLESSDFSVDCSLRLS